MLLAGARRSGDRERIDGALATALEQLATGIGDLRSLIEHAPANVRASAPTLADSTVRDSSLYEVEVLGELTPEWLARRWESKFPRVLQVMELRAVRPSPTRACTARRGK